MTMRKIKNLLIAIFVIGFMSSCSNRDHFISDATQRAEVEKDLQEKMAHKARGGKVGSRETVLRGICISTEKAFFKVKSF